ncbi:MAG: hypothetical protein HY513_03510 [Candidatus Aenigmarchaeota archaeon]|nr:hypothetical protein [Candidatus Aenigmarchaeota archaeon]
MKKLILLLMLFIIPMVFAQSIDVSSSGTCKNFDISVRANVVGCWDVKIDAPGHVITDEGPKDTFFYVNNALCNGKADMKLKFSTVNDMNATLKLRQNSTVIEKDFFVDQNCPAELSDEMSLGIVIIIILILLGAALWYMEVK